MLALQSLLGVILIPAAAYALARPADRMAPGAAARTVLAGLAIQAIVVLLLLKVPGASLVLDGTSAAVGALQEATDSGMRLVFGYLAGGAQPFDATRPEAQFILAFRGLPLILLVSALTRLLYYWGLLQRIVAMFAAVLRRAFGIGGALGTVASANIFLGMVEAPLLVRPYLAGMGRGALLASMAVGMATIAGTVMALYAAILGPSIPGAAGHLLAGSIMNAPAALMLSRLALDRGFADEPVDAGPDSEHRPRSAIDALVAGTMDGVRLLVAVAAMLIVATALVALVNIILQAASRPLGASLKVEQMLGWAAAPIAFVIGIPWAETATAGTLIAKKVVLNEFVAYLDLATTPAAALSDRSRLILTYALCGFANLGSLGIMIGGMTAMAPERRADILELAPLSVLVGLMATLLSGAVVGTLTGL